MKIYLLRMNNTAYKQNLNIQSHFASRFQFKSFYILYISFIEKEKSWMLRKSNVFWMNFLRTFCFPMQLLPALQRSDDARDDVVIATLHAVVVTRDAAVCESVDDRLLEWLKVVDVGEEEEEERYDSGVLDKELAVWFERWIKHLSQDTCREKGFKI